MNIEKAEGVLANAVQVDRWHVTADTLPEIGWLIEHGYLAAVDDYEGPNLCPTKKGRRYISKKEAANA